MPSADAAHADARQVAMASNERYVSPYLLRPLRTFEQELRGRSGTDEPDDSFEGLQGAQRLRRAARDGG
jgi:hypothetical protein